MKFIDIIMFPFALAFVCCFLVLCWIYLAIDFFVKKIVGLFSRKG